MTLKKFALRQWNNIYPKSTCVYFIIVDKLSNRETDSVESRPDGIPSNAMPRISFDTLTLMWIRFVYSPTSVTIEFLISHSTRPKLREIRGLPSFGTRIYSNIFRHKAPCIR